MSAYQKNPQVYCPESIKYDDGIETNIYSIAKQICNQPPQPPNTIQLILDHDVPSGSNLDDFEFALVRTFCLACINILFGENINPLELTEKQIDRLKDYVKSIGYNLVIEVEESEDSYKFILLFQRYRENILDSRLDHLINHTKNE